MANLKYIGKNILNHDLILKKGDVSGSNASSASFGHINISNNASVDGNLVVDGRLTAQEIHTEIESASIIFSSGSTLFGNTQDDIHTFTGSLKVTGSVTALNLTADSSSFSTRVTDLKSDSGSFSTRVTDLKSDSGSFSTRVTKNEGTGSKILAGQLNFTDITATGTVQAEQLTSTDDITATGIITSNERINIQATNARLSLGPNAASIGSPALHGGVIFQDSSISSAALGNISGFGATTSGTAANYYLLQLAGGSGMYMQVANNGAITFPSATSFSVPMITSTGDITANGNIVGDGATQIKDMALISGSATSTGSFGSVMQNGKHFPQTNAPGENIAFGTDAGSAFVGGNVNKINVAIGLSAGSAMADYGGNVFIGKNAAKLRTRGDDNVVIGTSAGGTDGDDFGDKNVFIGLSTGLAINSTNSDANVFIGNAAGTAGTTSISNVLIGDRAGNTLTDSRDNVAIGTFAGQGRSGITATTLNNGIYIGRSAKSNAADSNNEIVIGSEAVGHGTDTITFGDNQITDVYFASGSSTGATFHGIKDFAGNISGSATSTGSFAFGKIADKMQIGEDPIETGNVYLSVSSDQHTGLYIQSVGSGKSPSISLTRSDGKKFYVQHEANGLNHKMYNGSSIASWMFVDNSNDPLIGIGNTSPSEKIDVTGNIKASGNISGSATSTGSFGRLETAGVIIDNNNVSATSFTGIFNGALSGSAQIASNISGAFAVASASFAADILSNSSSFAARDTLSEATSSKILNGELEFTNITGSGHISMSLSSTGSFGRVSATTIGGHSPLVIDGKTTFVHSITSSAHVSSSMASTASFGRVNVIGLGGHQNLTIDPITTFTNVITASANVNFDSKIFIQTGSIEGDLHVRTNADLMRIGKSTTGLLVSGSGEIPRFATASNGDLIDLGFTILDEDGNSVLAGNGDGIHVDDNNYWYNNRFYKVGNGSTKFLEYDAIDLKYKGQVFATTGSIDGEMYIKSPTGSMFIGKYTGGIPTSGSSTTIPRFATGSDGSLVDLGFTTTDEDGNTVFLTTGDGIVVDSNNYWYTTGHFKIGNSKNFINWNTSNLTISGTFVGDGSGLTGVSGGGGSSFTKAGISGSFTVLSSSFSSRLTTAEAELSLTLLSSSAQVKSLLPTNVISSSKQIASGISGSITQVSGALSTRLTTLEGNAVFTSAGISGSTTVLSSSLASRIKSLEAGGVTVPTNTVSSSAQLASRISGSFTSLSASLAGRITSGGGGGSDNLGNHTATQNLNLDNNAVINASNVSGSSTSTGSFGNLFGFVTPDFANSRLGIGTDAPAVTFHVKGSSNQVARFENDNGALRIVNVSVSDNFGSGNRSVLGDNSQDVLITTTTGGGTPNNSFILLNHDGNVRIAAGGSPGANEGITVLDGGNVNFSGNVSGSATSTGSFGRVEVEHIHSTDDMTVGDDLTVSGLTTSDTAVIGGTSITQTNTILEINKASGNHHLTMLAADNASNSLRFRNASGQEVYAGMFGDVSGGQNKFGVYASGLRFVVDQSGNVGINNPNPPHPLTVTGIISGSGTGYFGNIILGGTEQIAVNNGNLYYTGGNLGIGTTNPGVALEVIGSVSGSATSTGSFGRVEVNGTQLTPSPITALNNATANELVTVGSTTTELDAEANLTFDGSNGKLNLSGLNYPNIRVVGNQLGYIMVGDAGATSNYQNYQIVSDADNFEVRRVNDAVSVVNSTPFKISSDKVEVLNISGSATSTGSFGHIIGDGSGITNVTSTVPTGTVSGSAQITAGLPSGVVSGSSGNLTVTNTITATTGSISNIQTPLTGRVISNFTELIKVTVVSDGGNHYAFEGATAPSIQVSEGKTYRFDISDSTVGSHPFRFSTTQDGQHNGGSAYTTGVTVVGTQGQAGAYVEIQITKGTANALYYYCTAHPGMGNDGRLLKNDLMNLAAIKVTGNQVDFTNLPTSDPSVAGRLWNDSGTVKISSG